MIMACKQCGVEASLHGLNVAAINAKQLIVVVLLLIKYMDALQAVGLINQ